MIPIRNKKKTLQVTVDEMRNFAFAYVEKYAPSKQQLKTYLLKKYMKLSASDVRKNLNQLKFKAGILVKIPKKSQSKLVDLPVIGLNTLRLIKKANLNGIAIYPKHTLIHEKRKVLQYAKKYKLKIYDAAQ